MEHSQGFGVVVVVGILASIVLVGGVVFVNNQNNGTKSEESKMMEEKLKIEEGAMLEKKMTEEKMIKEQDSMEVETEAVTKKEDKTVMQKEESMEGDNMMKKEDSIAMQKSGAYTAYDSNTLVEAQKGKTVLFFHASWCPTCRSADADITAGVGTIPTGVTILKTDYDKEVALKQKYGVTSQHTFVEVDSSGNLIQKWSGGNLAGIVAKL